MRVKGRRRMKEKRRQEQSSVPKSAKSTRTRGRKPGRADDQEKMQEKLELDEFAKRPAHRFGTRQMQHDLRDPDRTADEDRDNAEHGHDHALQPVPASAPGQRGDQTPGGARWRPGRAYKSSVKFDGGGWTYQRITPRKSEVGKPRRECCYSACHPASRPASGKLAKKPSGHGTSSGRITTNAMA